MAIVSSIMENSERIYSMLHSPQIWRALRLVVDIGLHFKGKSRDWAIKLFADYTWDTSDKVEKEVTRYQSIPGQAVTYMLGQLSIMELKKEAETTLGESFNLKDFHFQVLMWQIGIIQNLPTFFFNTWNILSTDINQIIWFIFSFISLAAGESTKWLFNNGLLMINIV